MKDSAEKIGRAARLTGIAALIAVSACSKSNKANDVAQDSILVKDADIAEHKTDTAGAATAALVRERDGSGAKLPTLTSGAPVTPTADVAPPVGAATRSPSQPRMQPPRRVNPSPVLPPRESTSGNSNTSVTATPVTPPPTMQPPPVAQPVSPSPPLVSQPIPPAPKKDTSRDSLSVRG